MRTLALLFTSLFLASSLPAGEVPRPVTELTLRRLQQPPLKLSTFRGKIIALAFIHTTCSHCQQLTVLLNKIQPEYASKNVQVVAAAYEEGVDQNYPMYLKVIGPKFPTGIVAEADVKKFVKWNQKVDGGLMVPYMLFIDAKGVIRGDFNGKDGFYVEMEKNIRAQLDKMTQPAPAPAKKK
ncbi:MAG: TlpA disulfide reductase family protein [Candidatus Solibacter sp.]